MDCLAIALASQGLPVLPSHCAIVSVALAAGEMWNLQAFIIVTALCAETGTLMFRAADIADRSNVMVRICRCCHRFTAVGHFHIDAVGPGILRKAQAPASKIGDPSLQSITVV
ncbi:hypothetical protein JL39_22090 [Rhizobium sp. YS-1r]|nr:hypothetical protein JL39_22090 [Rhizobium sp. YS-1r]